MFFTRSCDVLIIGGGAAGMACALSLSKQKKSVILADRNERLGGVLLQCKHSGFGRAYFGRSMTGVEYAEIFADKILKMAEVTQNTCTAQDHPAAREPGSVLADHTKQYITIMTDTEVLEVRPDRTALLSGIYGREEVSFEKVVFATGCRERTIFSQMIEGTRPAGVMTCGTAQKLINVYGLDVGDNIVILGTGDIGQIMARQLKQAGKNIICMIEQNSSPGGRLQNRKDCIEAYDIPVLLNSTISGVYGNGRVEAVKVRNLISGEEQLIACGTLLTAIGLIPEMELAENIYTDDKMTAADRDAYAASATASLDDDSKTAMPTRNTGAASAAASTNSYSGKQGNSLPDWAFKVGNCDFVHDIVDSVTFDAQRLKLY